MTRKMVLAYRLVALVELTLAGLVIGMGDWWSAFPALTVAYLFWMWPVHDLKSFRHGWRQGRFELLEASTEAHARTLDPWAFIAAEVERTVLSDQVRPRE